MGRGSIVVNIAILLHSIILNFLDIVLLIQKKKSLIVECVGNDFLSIITWLVIWKHILVFKNTFVKSVESLLKLQLVIIYIRWELIPDPFKTTLFTFNKFILYQKFKVV